MEPTKTTRSFRINDDIWELLKKEAENRGTSASALVTLAITEHLSDVLRKEGGIDAIELLKIIGGLKEQTQKLSNDLDKALSDLPQASVDKGKQN